jgi:glycyl-tRNA synthetase
MKYLAELINDRKWENHVPIAKWQRIIGKWEMAVEENGKYLIPSPVTGTIGVLTLPWESNLMFQTHIGAASDDTSVAYLHPETAHGRFVNVSNVANTTCIKIPYGIAQMGRSFRNEITPTNFVFRSREFDQMELEFGIDDSEEAWQNSYRYEREE